MSNLIITHNCGLMELASLMSKHPKHSSISVFFQQRVDDILECCQLNQSKQKHRKILVQ